VNPIVFTMGFFESLRVSLARCLTLEVEQHQADQVLLDLTVTRDGLARRYIRGSGIEFGALHFPLSIPPGVTVKYADLKPAAELRVSNPDVADIKAPDIITDFESMTGVGDDSQDFVIANHVLEHVEDPLRALKSVSRVLHARGVAYLALPDKRFTFDKHRQITSLDHMIKDHRDGPDWSVAAHYDEWCRCVDGLSDGPHAEKVAIMLEQHSNIHFHVWDYPAMLNLFAYVMERTEFGLDVELSVLNGIEVVWILRRRG
jgi:SAM-dependent methyltransferase